MQTLRQYIHNAKTRKVAMGHFNFSNLEGLYAIARAARTLNVPVIVGVSEGEEEAVGIHQAVSLVHIIRRDWNLPIFLNADHHYSVATVKAAIDAGFDSVIFDGASLPLEENIAKSKECVSYARGSGRDVLVEVELGYIGQSSKMLDAIPDGVEMLTSPEDAKRMIRETEADMLAPAVGNFHGMLKHAAKPRLNIESIAALRNAVSVPLVLHGGSGEEADFKEAIESGMCIVHVNTELRRAYTSALQSYLEAHPDDIAPYKYGANASLRMEEVVREKLKIFNNL